MGPEGEGRGPGGCCERGEHGGKCAGAKVKGVEWIGKKAQCTGLPVSGDTKERTGDQGGVCQGRLGGRGKGILPLSIVPFCARLKSEGGRQERDHPQRRLGEWGGPLHEMMFRGQGEGKIKDPGIAKVVERRGNACPQGGSLGVDHSRSAGLNEWK